MERWKTRMDSWVLLLVILSCLKLGFSDSIDDDGVALLRFRGGVEVDPFGALSNWGKPGVDHCFWHGVDCSNDGGVVSLNLKDLCLEGKLASEIGKLVHLKSLILHNNSFSGAIPGEIGDLRNLELLDLGHNNLSGPFPLMLLKLTSLKTLVLRNNKFIYDIPSELYELNMFSELQVDEEMLCSNRGSHIRKVENATIRRLLQEISTHRKRLEHERHRHTKNVASAPMHSPSPSPQPSASLSQSPSISTTPHFSPVGPPSPAASPDTSSPSSAPPPTPLHDITRFYSSASAPPKATGKHKETHWAVYVSIGAAVLVLVALSLLYYFCYQTNRVVSVMPWKTGLSGQLQKAFVTGVPSLKRSELETACEDFSNIIGTLSGCSLYKGTLSNGVEIAVTSRLIKSAKDWSDQSEALFRKKILVLSKVNHKNFMNLIGYCEEPEPFTRMMVYEYAPNGTLFEHLHIKEAEPLDWAARLRVAMGIAYCLEHMHKLDPPMILRNLNSSIVYLTEDYAAKISDLSFWNEEKETNLSFESPGVLEPPLSNVEEIVYKFGIILLELISGRLPFSKDYGLLVLWASSYLTGKRPLNGIVDETLKSIRDEDVTAFCHIILSCVNLEPRERPTMAEVVAQLRQITAMTPDAASPKLSPLWWAELEIISTEST